MTFTPLNKMRYPERIAKTIQMRILNGKNKCGERLPSELVLAGEFDVSRSVIREAMRILDGLGLIKIKKGPKGGIFVSDGYHKPLSNSLRGLLDSGQVSIEHIFMVRLLMEPNVAAEAARNAMEEDVRELRAILEESEKHMDDAVLMQANRGQFHILLAKASGNPIMEMFMQSLIELLREYFYDFKSVEFEREAIASHKKILMAIQNRNADKARDLMAGDILKIKDLVRKMDKRTISDIEI
jgi:GntR family transcriptional repressor for pyruvate dehydrogenase complex